jgi:esterase/lipase superfamily enzyme
MKRAYHRWFSPTLQRDMELLVFGETGARVLAFPTSMGRYHEWEDRCLVRSLGDRIGAGRIQLYSLDSIDTESWYARDRTPAERAQRHDAYDRYVRDEVLPFAREQNPNPFVIVTGAGFGGYHAINFALRHPEACGRLLAMSALCDIKTFTDGYYDETVYFHNPLDFLVGEHDPARLDAIRKLDIILAVGREDSLRAGNEALSRLLWRKNIWHALRIWNGFAHDWPDWAHMLHLYVEGHD